MTPAALLMSKQAKVHGVIVGSRRQQQEYVAALEQTGIHPVIDRSFTMADLAAAFRMQQSGRHFGKIVVEWWQPQAQSRSRGVVQGPWPQSYYKEASTAGRFGCPLLAVSPPSTTIAVPVM